MKKIKLNEKQKHFLKKVSVISGVVGGTILTLYFLNKSEIGYEIKYGIIKKLGDSIILDNNRYFFSHYVGDGSCITADHIHSVGGAVSAVIDPIAEAAGYPPLSRA